MAAATSALSFVSLKQSWDVFLLFSIPIGGGMPAGVLLAKNNGMGWLAMTLLYLLSDILLAIYFEPLIRFFIYLSHHVAWIAKMRAILKMSNDKVLARYGQKPSPLQLIGIAFGVDPMTGRAAAMAAGHNFFTGWAIAIAGDMIFFAIIAISTITLNGILGDGTLTALIILALMFGVPAIIKKIRRPRDPQL